MTTAKLRMPGLIAVLVSLVVGLTACGTGPSQVNSAVIIDGTAISVDEVQALVDKVVREQPAARPLARERKLDLVAREALSQLILHDVLVDVARAENISVDHDELVEAKKRDPFGEELPADGSVPPDALAAELVYRARDQHEAITDRLLMAELGDKYYDRLAVTMDYSVVSRNQGGGSSGTMREQAEAMARQFAANPDRVGDIIAEDAANGLDAREGAVFFAQQSPQLAASVMFGAPEGSVVAFEPAPGQALWVIGVIREHDTNAAPQVAEPVAPTRDQLIEIGKRLLQPYLADASIRISPRYGVWDPVAQGVAPSEAETAGLVIAPGEPARDVS